MHSVKCEIELQVIVVAAGVIWELPSLNCPLKSILGSSDPHFRKV